MKHSPAIRFFLFLLVALTLCETVAWTQGGVSAQSKADQEIVAGVALLQQTNKQSQAIAHFNAAIRWQPKYPLAHLWRGDAFEKWGDAAPPNSKLRLSRYEMARDSYERALQFAPPGSIDARDAQRKRASVENKISQTQPGPAISVYLGSQPLALPLPATKAEGQIRLPLDIVVAALGARKIGYDPLVNTIKYELDGRVIQVQLNVRLVTITEKTGDIVNQRRVILDRPIVEVRSKGRDYATVEADFFREALGADVQWDDRTRVLRIVPAIKEVEKVVTIYGTLTHVDTVPPITLTLDVSGNEQTFNVASDTPMKRQSVKTLDTVSAEMLASAQPDDFKEEVAAQDLTVGDKVVLQHSNQRGVLFVGDFHSGRTVKPTPTPEPTPEPVNADSYTSTIETTAHEQGALSLAISPDGSTLATGGTDEKVKIWKVSGKKAELLHSWSTGSPVNALAFSPDGETVASGGQDRIVRLWQVKKERLLKKLSGHLGPLVSLAFSPDGVFLAAGSREDTSVLPTGEVQVWHVESGRAKQKLPVMQSPCTGLAYSKTGLLATINGRYYVDLWRLQGGSYDYARTFLDRWGRNTAIAFSPDSRYLAAANDDGSLRVWNMGSTSKEPLWKSRSDSPLTAVAFVPDSSRVVVGNAAGQLRIQDASDGRVIAAWPRGSRNISIVAVAINRSAQVIAVQNDGKMVVWSPRR